MSCDKLVVIGREMMMLENFLNKSLVVKKHGIARLPYRHFFELIDGSFLQVGERKSGHSASVRYEFNPNKCVPEVVWGILRCIKFERYSRIDIAIDYYGIDLGGAMWIQHFERTKGINYYVDGGGRLETLYIGSRESNLMHRIYDKARERKKAGEEVEGFWWRVEAECKFDKEQAIHPWYNPFERIECLLENDFGGLAMKDRAMVEYLQRHPNEWSKLDSRNKRKYRDMIAGESSKLNPSPSDVYKKENDKLYQQLVAYEEIMFKIVI